MCGGCGSAGNCSEFPIKPAYKRPDALCFNTFRLIILATCVCVKVCVFICLYVCVYLHMYMCVCLHFSLLRVSLFTFYVDLQRCNNNNNNNMLHNAQIRKNKTLT